MGPGVVKEIRKRLPDSRIVGYDIGYFARNITSYSLSPDAYLDAQFYGDVREFPDNLLKDIDVVISLAAISNDPIGNKFEKPTLEINYEANKKIAALAKRAGVRRFVFASSCSVYGAAEDEPRKEDSTLNPLTAYARSKLMSEEALEKLADSNFQVTCLRFATACDTMHELVEHLVAQGEKVGLIKVRFFLPFNVEAGTKYFYQLYTSSENFGLVIFPKESIFPELEETVQSLGFKQVESGEAVMRSGSKNENFTYMMPEEVQKKHRLEKFIILQILTDGVGIMVGIYEQEFGLTLPTKVFIVQELESNISKTLDIFRKQLKQEKEEIDWTPDAILKRELIGHY